MARNVAESARETTTLASLDKKLAIAKRCARGNSEGVIAGAKAAVFASTTTAIPTMLPWARAYLNPTTQALIVFVSTVGGMAYFISADKTVLAKARRNSFNGAPSQSLCDY